MDTITLGRRQEMVKLFRSDVFKFEYLIGSQGGAKALVANLREKKKILQQCILTLCFELFFIVKLNNAFPMF